ncbi:MAG TPA: ATP-binding protein [Gemmatimonadaceae bacterium]|nr:ATP-binding protein [Gemmatimonadaceae bacterium]
MHAETLTAPIEAGSTVSEAAGPSRLLRVPLLVKLLGANLAIALLAWGAVVLNHRAPTPAGRLIVAVGFALVAGMAVNVTLVMLALRPIRDLERTAWRIWHGDSGARVPRSPIGDKELDQVGGTLNALLDHLDQDRIRMRGLASEVIRAEDRERARIGHELHESIAQALAGVTYQLTAAETDARDPNMAGRLRAIRVMTGQVLDSVDVLSHTVHPRVLNDLGLLAGLRHLARTVGNEKHPIEVVVNSGSEEAFRGIGMETAAVLYRVAQDALQNAIRHARARNIQIVLGASDNSITMRVADDGIGFDLAEAKARRPGMGLFTMGERVALVRGEFAVATQPGRGTTVGVRIPIERASYQPTNGKLS